MKHLLFLRNLNTEEDVLRIQEAMEGTRIEYEVILDRQCVVIQGRNDVVHAAKTVLSEAGFIIN